jgi:hydroxyacyl-ACP dehydratase HTD2-like protein with hotdog domain
MVDSPPIELGSRMTELVRTPDIITLFEFSAACWLPHRIHYDLEYATSEGHEGLVVHGPLQGCYLALMASEWADQHGGELIRIAYRHKQKAIAGRKLVCDGEVTSIGDRVNPVTESVERIVRCDVWVEDMATGARTTEGQCDIRLVESR